MRDWEKPIKQKTRGRATRIRSRSPQLYGNSRRRNKRAQRRSIAKENQPSPRRGYSGRASRPPTPPPPCLPLPSEQRWKEATRTLGKSEFRLYWPRNSAVAPPGRSPISRTPRRPALTRRKSFGRRLSRLADLNNFPSYFVKNNFRKYPTLAAMPDKSQSWSMQNHRNDVSKVKKGHSQYK